MAFYITMVRGSLHTMSFAVWDAEGLWSFGCWVIRGPAQRRAERSHGPERAAGSATGAPRSRGAAAEIFRRGFPIYAAAAPSRDARAKAREEGRNEEFARITFSSSPRADSVPDERVCGRACGHGGFCDLRTGGNRDDSYTIGLKGQRRGDARAKAREEGRNEEFTIRQLIRCGNSVESKRS
jgi:hypothetical protein